MNGAAGSCVKASVCAAEGLGKEEDVDSDDDQKICEGGCSCLCRDRWTRTDGQGRQQENAVSTNEASSHSQEGHTEIPTEGRAEGGDLCHAMQEVTLPRLYRDIERDGSRTECAVGWGSSIPYLPRTMTTTVSDLVMGSNDDSGAGVIAAAAVRDERVPLAATHTADWDDAGCLSQHHPLPFTCLLSDAGCSLHRNSTYSRASRNFNATGTSFFQVSLLSALEEGPETEVLDGPITATSYPHQASDSKESTACSDRFAPLAYVSSSTSARYATHDGDGEPSGSPHPREPCAIAAVSGDSNALTGGQEIQQLSSTCSGRSFELFRSVALGGPCSSSPSHHTTDEDMSISTAATLQCHRRYQQQQQSLRGMFSGSYPRDADGAGGGTREGLEIPRVPTDICSANGHGSAYRAAHQSCLEEPVREGSVESKFYGVNEDGEFAVLNGKYVVYSHTLGKGSYSVVRLCYGLENGVYYAAKTIDCRRLHRHCLDADMAVKREVLLMKQLRERHIIALHEVLHDRCEGCMYLILELAECGEVLSMRGDGAIIPFDDGFTSFTEAMAVRVVTGVLRALMYAHHLGIAHRDVKPTNILLTSDGTVKLGDYGVSTVVNDNCMARVRREGSVAFLAPEMLASPEFEVACWTPSHSSLSISRGFSFSQWSVQMDADGVVDVESSGSCPSPGQHSQHHQQQQPQHPVPSRSPPPALSESPSVARTGDPSTVATSVTTDAHSTTDTRAFASCACLAELSADRSAPHGYEHGQHQPLRGLCDARGAGGVGGTPVPQGSEGAGRQPCREGRGDSRAVAGNTHYRERRNEAPAGSTLPSTTSPTIVDEYKRWCEEAVVPFGTDLFKGDTFSLGVTAYTLLMGELPWRAVDASSQLSAILEVPDPFRGAYEHAYGDLIPSDGAAAAEKAEENAAAVPATASDGCVSGGACAVEGLSACSRHPCAKAGACAPAVRDTTCRNALEQMHIRHSTREDSEATTTATTTVAAETPPPYSDALSPETEDLRRLDPAWLQYPVFLAKHDVTEEATASAAATEAPGTVEEEENCDGDAASVSSLEDSIVDQELLRGKDCRPFSVTETRPLPAIPGGRGPVSATAVDFVRACLCVHPTERRSVFELFQHPWIQCWVHTESSLAQRHSLTSGSMCELDDRATVAPRTRLPSARPISATISPAHSGDFTTSSCHERCDSGRVLSPPASVLMTGEGSPCPAHTAIVPDVTLQPAWRDAVAGGICSGRRGTSAGTPLHHTMAEEAGTCASGSDRVVWERVPFGSLHAGEAGFMGESEKKEGISASWELQASAAALSSPLRRFLGSQTTDGTTPPDC